MEKPLHVQNIIAPSLTPTDSSMNPEDIAQLWRTFRSDVYEGVIFKGKEKP